MAKKTVTAPDTAVIYCRVSTDGQAERGVSLQAQEENARSYCAMRGFRVVGIFIDAGVSGTKDMQARPEGAKMLTALSSGLARNLVVIKMDRLFRSSMKFLNLQHGLQGMGVALHLMDLQIDGSTTMGKAMFTIMSAQNQMERDLIADRTREALGSIKRRGGAYNHVPYGYHRVDSSSEHRTWGQLMVDPVEMATVERIFRLHAEGTSMHGIARMLEKEKVPTKKGGIWAVGIIRSILIGNPRADELRALYAKPEVIEAA